MALSNFHSNIVAATVLRTLEAELVTDKITFQKYSGKVKSGASLTFPSLADPTVSAYGGTVTYEELVDSAVTMPINQETYFGFKVDKLDQQRAGVNLLMDQSKRAGYGLKKSCDEYVLGLYAGLTAGVTATITTANILSTLAEIGTQLAEQNVDHPWIVLPPSVIAKIKLAGVRFQVNSGSKGGKGGAEVFVQDDIKMDIYQSNLVTESSSDVFEVLAGSYESIGFAQQIMDVETIQVLQGYRGSAVQGFHVYGAKILKEYELVRATLTIGSETTI